MYKKYSPVPHKTLTVLGIDPGTRRIGYGVISKQQSSISLIDAGLLPIKATDDHEALTETKKSIDALLRRFHPDVLATEKLFFAKNRKTALQVAQARGVIILAGIEAGIPIKEYAPNEIKAALTGYGSADKSAVLKMVRLILKDPSLSVIDDVSDAIGIAIVASNI